MNERLVLCGRIVIRCLGLLLCVLVLGFRLVLVLIALSSVVVRMNLFVLWDVADCK